MNRFGHQKNLAALAILFGACLVDRLQAQAVELSFDPRPRIGLRDHDDVAISAPTEGLWSIGLGWGSDWPQRWIHADPAERTVLGAWTILKGTLGDEHESWTVQDRYRTMDLEGVDGQGVFRIVHCKRRWHYQGDRPSGPTVLSVRFQVNRGDEPTPLRPLLPGINYFGNPSGSRIDPQRVPTWSGRPGAEALYEEHRYPLPLASVERDHGFVAAIHSRPSTLPHAARQDLWWSLGLIEHDAGTELTLLSGPVATNDRRGFVKARQTKLLPYRNAHLVNVPPDTVIEKEFYLQLAVNPSRGHGFATPLWTSIELFDPVADRSMPRCRDVIGAKLRDTFDRWHQDDQCCGFRTRPPQAQPWFMMGWADRAEVPGHTLLALDLSGFCDDPDVWKQRAAASLDFLITSPSLGGERDAEFSIAYDYQRHRWLQRQNPLSQAQALNAMADAVAIARQRNVNANVDGWASFLRSKLTRLANLILDPSWRPVSTHQAFAIAPLVKGSELFDDAKMISAAVRVAEHTIDRHRTMDEPYWGGTLDAKCEDKEGAWAALQGMAELYRVTGEPKYLDAAIHAGDVCLSYLYIWDVTLPPGRLADHGLRTRGWTSVSVQNQHLDVFGVVFTPTLWQLGQWTGRRRYQQLARLMLVSCGQMTDLATGVQGEQLFQTNYQQHEAGDTVEGMRGGYSERWNIYWISAHFLTAVAGLEKLGVDWKAF